MDILQDPAPGNKRRWLMIGLASLSALLSWFCRNSLTVIFPDISQDLNLSAQDLGLLSSIFFYFFAGCQLPLGFLLAKLGVRSVMTVGILLAALGCVLFALAPSAYMALAGRALIGMGTSVSVMGGMVVAALWFSTAHFALLSGIIMGVAGIGSLLATSPWVVLVHAIGWRSSMLIVAVVLFLVTIACFAIMRNPSKEQLSVMQENRFSLKQAAKSILFSIRFWIMGLNTCCRYGFLSTLQAVWAGPLLIYGLGLSQFATANILLLLAIGYMLGMPLMGIMSDRWFTSRKWVVCCGQLLLAGLAFSFLWWGPNTPMWVIVFTFVLLPLLSAAGNAVFAHVKEINPPEFAPAAIAWTNIFPMLGGAIFIQITSLFLPADVTSIGSPQDLSHLWWLGGIAAGITGICYALFIPESPAMLRLRERRRQLKEGSSAGVR